MFELNLDDDPFIVWAALWVNDQEAQAITPCRRCKRRTLAHRAIRGLILAAALTFDLFVLTRFGVI